MEYKVCKNGIFKSIQGEGFNSGKSTIFVRLAGCNMEPRCYFCDEKFDEYTVLNESEIKEGIERLMPCALIVITGGEPTMYPMDCLVKKLKQFNVMIGLETNGTNCIDADFDWITCSPKTEQIELNNVDELKFVVDQEKDHMVKFIRTICKQIQSKHIFLQPKSNEKKYIDIALKIIEKNPNFQLSIQLHKILEIK